MKDFLKKNWTLILVVLYIISPIDILPFNPLDDLGALLVERLVTAVLNNMKTTKTTTSTENN